jgi:DNA-binding CsgD family transcriptional regulator
VVVSARFAPQLLERDLELAAADAFLQRVCQGRGGRLLVIGPAGIGKSALVDAVSEQAIGRGMVCLSGQTSEVASQVGFGVAQAALGSLWPDEAGRGDWSDDAPTTDLVPAVLARGVAAVLDLADERPVLLSIDDVEWADPASLRWLALLAQRGAGARVGILLTARFHEPTDGQAALAALLDEHAAVVLRPAVLSERSATELLGARLGVELEPEIRDWCRREAGGNPYLLHALADGLRQSGVQFGDAAQDRLREIGSLAVSGRVASRLERLDAVARSFIEGVAAVGDMGGLVGIAAVVGTDPAVAMDAARRLVRDDLLRSVDPPELSHPVMGAAIRAQVEAARRELLARRAAERLLADGLVEQAAAQLLELPPRQDPAVAETLASAASLASGRGATDIAATLLRRALAEPPPPERRAELGTALGESLLSLGSADAVHVLERALAEAKGERETATIAASLARALNYARRLDESITVLEQARAGLGPQHADLDEELDALAIHFMSFEPALRSRRLAHLHRLGDARGASELAHRCRLAELASESLIACRPATETVALAQRALAGGLLLSRGIHAYYKAVIVLGYAGQPGAARAQLHDAIALARVRGDSVALGFAITLHGEVRRLEGDVLRTEIDTRTGLDLLPPGELGPRFILRGLIESLVDQGRVAEAEEELRLGQLTGELPEIMPTPGLLYARARVRIGSGSVSLGLEDLLRTGEVAERLELHDPISVPWRLAAAESLAALGDRARAGELVSEQLGLARRCGLPEAVGAALRVEGLVVGGVSGAASLQEAVRLLDRGFARLEFARALVDLGAATSNADRASARGLLEHGATLAEELGATALADHAGELSIAAGSRPRRSARRGPAALTAAERRTARLAAEGMTNSEIAQTLVLSGKTVESQLRAAFRKLGISSRGELPVALGGSQATSERAPGPEA